MNRLPLILLFFVSVVHAQTPLMKACGREVKELCGFLPEPNIVDFDYRCMKRLYDKQSPGCLAYLLSVVKDPCFVDQVKSCPKEVRPLAFWDKCLPMIRSKLTPNCLKRVTLFEQMEKLIDTLCPTVVAQCPDPKKKYFRYCLYKAIEAKSVTANCQKVLTLRYDL